MILRVVDICELYPTGLRKEVLAAVSQQCWGRPVLYSHAQQLPYIVIKTASF